MNAALRHDRKATHEANNLAPPLMYPRLLSQLPEHDNRGDTPLETTHEVNLSLPLRVRDPLSLSLSASQEQQHQPDLMIDNLVCL